MIGKAYSAKQELVCSPKTAENAIRIVQSRSRSTSRDYNEYADGIDLGSHDIGFKNSIFAKSKKISASNS